MAGRNVPVSDSEGRMRTTELPVMRYVTAAPTSKPTAPEPATRHRPTIVKEEGAKSKTRIRRVMTTGRTGVVSERAREKLFILTADD
jgi:hypothetical protein